MSAPSVVARSSHRLFLVVAVLCVGLADAILAGLTSTARPSAFGALAATADQIAWLEILYLSAKMLGYLAAGPTLQRLGFDRSLSIAVCCLALSALGTMISNDLWALGLLRILAGVGGGVALVIGQTCLFWTYPLARQPIVQAIFAIGAVVAPATVAPAVQGWLGDEASWAAISFSSLPLAVLALGLTQFVRFTVAQPVTKAFPVVMLITATVAVGSTIYVLVQGPRLNWELDSGLGIGLLVAILSAKLLWILHRRGGRHRIDLSPFGVENFSFAFVVSFVAGAALLGSGFLIQSFSIGVTGLPPYLAGELLLPSALFFTGSLGVAATLFSRQVVPPLATVPVGILCLSVAMFLLSRATAESSFLQVMPALLVRGFGLGCLFLSITLLAFGGLARRSIASGIGLFNVGRQLGGLIGIAGLQTLIDRQAAFAKLTLSASVQPGSPVVEQRLNALTAHFVGKSYDVLAAKKLAVSSVARSLAEQSQQIAYQSAFASVVVFFLIAAPLVVVSKKVIGLRYRRLLAGSNGRQVKPFIAR